MKIFIVHRKILFSLFWARFGSECPTFMVFKAIFSKLNIQNVHAKNQQILMSGFAEKLVYGRTDGRTQVNLL